MSPRCTFQTDQLNLDFDFNQFKIGNANINSIQCQGRLQQIEEILKSNNFSAFCLQETKICPLSDPSCFSVPGYTSYYRHRSRRGGGVLIFCRSDLTSRQLVNLENSTPDLEHVCIELFCNGKRILLSSMYRPPGCNKQSFKLNLTATLEKLRNNKPHVNIITGDYNCGANHKFFGTLPTTPFDFEVTNIFQQNFLSQLVDIPTRYSTSINGH